MSNTAEPQTEQDPALVAKSIIVEEVDDLNVVSYSDLTVESAVEKLNEKDVEIKTLRKTIEEKDKEIELLQKELEAVKSVPVPLPSDSKPLSHLSKGRAKPKKAGTSTSTVTSGELQKEPESTEDSKVEEVKEEVVSPISKIAMMGGVNPFGGKPGNLFAGFNPSKVQLRSSSGSKPRTNSNHELTDIIVDEPHIRKWLNAKLNTDISTDTSLEKYLKDGQSLCQLMNVLRPEDPIKIQTGKLSFFHRENINHFLEGCEKLGINRLQLFETTDLLELNNFNQVLITLHCVEKLFPLEVESKTPEKEVLEVESEIPEKETTVEEAEKPVKDEAEESAQQ